MAAAMSAALTSQPVSLSSKRRRALNEHSASTYGELLQDSGADSGTFSLSRAQRDVAGAELSSAGS